MRVRIFTRDISDGAAGDRHTAPPSETGRFHRSDLESAPQLIDDQRAELQAAGAAAAATASEARASRR
jgi:hypothetical protein